MKDTFVSLQNKFWSEINPEELRFTLGNPKITHDSVTKYFKVSYTLKFVKEQWVQKEDFAVIIAAHLIQPQPKALPLYI